MLIMTMILTESDVLHVDENLIRIEECLYQKVTQIDSLSEVKAFLKKKLGENRVYLTVKLENSYDIYQQTVIAEPVTMESPAATVAPVAVVSNEPRSIPEVQEEKVLYYRGRPYTRP
jgi:hypothetical protein